MKLYLAGPMRGYPLFNFPAFDAAAERLRRYGHAVFNPADHDRTTHGEDFADGNVDGSEEAAAASHGFDLRVALGADLAFITREAEAVAVLPGWEASKGARAEVSTALALGLPVLPADAFWSWYVATPYDTARLITSTDPAPAAVDDRAVDELGPTSTVSGGFCVPGPDPIMDLTPYLEPIVGTSPIDAFVDVWAENLLHGLPDPDVFAGEVRSVSASGGAKGVKPERMSLIPAYPLGLVAEHYGKGAAKYDAHNWRRGYEFSKSLDAMLRHAYAFNDGEDNDPELGTSHLCGVVFHAFTLLQGLRDWPQYDDRFKPTDTETEIDQ